MSTDYTLQTIHLEIRDLESRVDRLVEVCIRLKDENLSLRDQQTNLMRERAKLIEHNDTARTRVEAILTRLRTLERNV